MHTYESQLVLNKHTHFTSWDLFFVEKLQLWVKKVSSEPDIIISVPISMRAKLYTRCWLLQAMRQFYAEFYTKLLVHSYICTESHMTHMVRSSYYNDIFLITYLVPSQHTRITWLSHDYCMWQWFSLKRNLAYPCFTSVFSYTFQIASKMVCKKSFINNW